MGLGIVGGSTATGRERLLDVGLPADDVVVLCYHTVGARWGHPMSVDPGALDEQLTWLQARGYRGITFGEAFEPGSGRRVAVTFDDAFRAVHQHALPVLDRLQMPATVFAPTAYVGQRAPLGWPGMDVGDADDAELAPMSWEELAELVACGWEVGSHSHTHPRLPGLGGDRLHDELHASRERCEEALGVPCRTFAYPFGELDRPTVQAVGGAGYVAAAALARPPGPLDPLAWPRVSVYRADSLDRFRRKLLRPARSALAAWALRSARARLARVP